MLDLLAFLLDEDRLYGSVNRLLAVDFQSATALKKGWGGDISDT
jgi:hypothetical protein